MVHRLHMVEDDPLRDHDFNKNLIVLVIGAVGAVHHEAPVSAGPQVELLEGVGEARRPPPPGETLRVAEGLEHVLPRCVEHARGDDLPIRRHVGIIHPAPTVFKSLPLALTRGLSDAVEVVELDDRSLEREHLERETVVEILQTRMMPKTVPSGRVKRSAGADPSFTIAAIGP